jgi:hypothetical protein
MIYYYTLFAIFVAIVTMMIIDQNVSIYINLLSKTLRLKIERIYWLIRFHPIIFASPIAKWWSMRKYEKTIKQLAQEITKNQKDAV